jgi:hypothetical protein
MNEHLTYVIIGIVAVTIIIFLINSNQPKQEITSPPILTLPPLNSETINSINIYDLSNDSILKPTITTPVPKIISILPTTTLLPPTTTLRPTTTLLPPTTTLLPPTTTLRPTTTLSPPTTTLSPAQRTLLDIINKQAELERKLKEQEDKEKEDLFNIPFIPIFDRNSSEAFIKGEGLYKIFIFPIWSNLIILSNTDTKIGGSASNILDNNKTTGIKLDVYYNYDKNINSDIKSVIIIAMPVYKTFKGKIKINLKTPYIGIFDMNLIPLLIKINTSNSFTHDYKKHNNNNSLNQLLWDDIKKNFYINSNYLESILVNMTYDDGIIINKDNLTYWNVIKTEYIIDVNFTKPFNSIIFEIYKMCQNQRIWITDISFEKSR